MNHYRAYGLRIRSEIALPELAPGESNVPVDVDVRLGTVDGPLPADEPRLVRFEADGAYLAWPHIGRFRADRDSCVTVDPLTDETQLIRFALLGPVFAAVLQFRGTPLLHGSAVAAGDRAIAFIGRKRAGKSTIAAAFAAAGCDVLNDDVLPLVREQCSIALASGFPALKLSPSIRQALLPGLPAIESHSSNGEKILVSCPGASSGIFPVAAVMVLEPDAPPEPVMLSGVAALQELLQHGYALKFGQGALANGQGEALFDSCARLARESLVLRVGRPENPRQLPDLARRLLSLCAPETQSA